MATLVSVLVVFTVVTVIALIALRGVEWPQGACARREIEKHLEAAVAAMVQTSATVQEPNAGIGDDLIRES